MADQDCTAVFDQPAKLREEVSFGEGIEGTGGLIQNNNVCITHEGTRQSNLLPFTDAYFGTILEPMTQIGISLVWQFLDDRIKSEDDVTKGTKVPVLGIIPNIKKDSDKLKVFLSPKSAVAESFRNLRTNLQFMVNHKQTHVIAVTSTVGAEGKTTACINLGGIISMSERKTIVHNLDMRKPTLHEKFELKNIKVMRKGLSGLST